MRKLRSSSPELGYVGEIAGVGASQAGEEIEREVEENHRVELRSWRWCCWMLGKAEREGGLGVLLRKRIR